MSCADLACHLLSDRWNPQPFLLPSGDSAAHLCRVARRDDDASGASCSGALEHHSSAGCGGGIVSRRDTAAEGQRRSSYASVTGEASSYARVHGEVSRAPAEWRDFPSVARETLDDVRYQKARGHC